MFLLLVIFLFPSSVVQAKTTTVEASPSPYESAATYAVVLDVSDHRVIYDKQANEKMYPASMTKVMSALVAREKIGNLEDKVVMSSEAFEGLAAAGASVAGFHIGQSVSYQDLLAGLLLPSGADAAKQLAISLYGSETDMVKAMNQKVQELGLHHTHFMNVSGLHDDEHYTTAYEMAEIVACAIKDKTLKTLLESDFYESKDHSFSLYPTTVHAKDYSLYFEGGKTGYTLEAKRCLASFSNYDDELLIQVIAGLDTTQQLISESDNLYRFVYQNNERKVVLKKGDKIGGIPVVYGEKEEYSVVAKQDYTYFINKNSKIEVVFKAEKELVAPVKKGQKIGEVSFMDGEKEMDKIMIKADKEMDKSQMKYMLDMLSNPVFLSVLAVVIGIGIIYCFRRWELRRRT